MIQWEDNTLLAFGRNDDINGKMPQSISYIQYMPPEVQHYGDPKALAKERGLKVQQAKKERHLENLKLAS